MIKDVTYDRILTRLKNHYRAQKKKLIALENQLLNIPTQQLRVEAAELSGYLDGLMKLDQLIKDDQADNQFPALDSF